MSRHRMLRIGIAVVGLGLAAPGGSGAQTQGMARPSGQAPRPTAQQSTGRVPNGLEVALLRSLQANPFTAPYGFATELQGRQIVLRGRVGTKQIHDVAIRTAIALGVPIVDGLVIDTAAVHQVAAAQTAYGSGGVGGGMMGSGQPGYSGYAGAGLGYPGAGTFGSLPYTYPPPLFGRLDDPFFGLEPPTISYPPWWNGLTARRLGLQAYPMPPGALANNPAPTEPAATNGSAAAPPVDPANANNNAAPAGAIPEGTIDMVIDARGFATLRGTVPTLADRIAIGQQVARTQGVAQVVNLLSVRQPTQGRAQPQGQAQGQGQPPALSDNPPPPPTPADATTGTPPRPLAPGIVGDGPPIVADSEPVAQRITRAIAARTGLPGQPVKVKVRDGVASISGRLPTVYEAMLAYRAVQESPGVREVEDRLEFVVPDGSDRNPLAEKGRPEDVEPYLEAQIRRQVGDLAHIDRVRAQGDSLDIRGTLARAEDRPRFDAILRSMPILRGFRMTAEVAAATP